MPRKSSKSYHFINQQQIMIKKNEDARLPKDLNKEYKLEKAAEGSKIE
jgi:hypothetical protein